MEYRFDDAIALLRRTPESLDGLLRDLPDCWTRATEGPGTWSPFDVVGHLIHAERANFTPRVRHLLTNGESAPFPPFDREAMFEASKGRTLGSLLDDFRSLRTESLDRLAALGLTEVDLDRPGRHPEFGRVLLRELLATWVAHDLTHLSQIVRTMAAQYSDAVGPWRAYLSVLRKP